MRRPGTLAIILIATLIALLTQGHGNPAPSTATTHAAPPTSHTPSPTPTKTQATSAQIVATDFTGKPYDAAVAQLVSMGFSAKNIQKNVTGPASSADKVNVVNGINPTGNVQFTQTITLSVYGNMTPPSTPTDTVTQVTKPAIVNQPATFNFGSAQCPAGQSLTDRQFYIDGKPSPTGPTQGSQGAITFTDTNPHQVSYTIFCNQVESGQSPSITVTATSSTPAP